MRNKALYVSMLVLVGVFLVSMYVLKGFYPQEFVLAVENQTILSIGEFIDSHLWLYYICCGITSFITYWFYLCACSHRWSLKWYENLIVLLTVVASILISIKDQTLFTVFSTTSFVFLPAICKGDMKTCGIVFTIHSFSQIFSLKIRNLPLFFTNIPNFISTILLTFECFLWLVLMYVIFNYKKGEQK